MHNPYQDSGTNQLYNMLFCDDVALYPAIEVSEESPEPRARLLAYRERAAAGMPVPSKELLGIVVEIGFEQGLDVLASYRNGAHRYINQSGKLLIWEATDDIAISSLTKELFAKGDKIVQQIGVWDKPRRAHPEEGVTRISFLAADGLYFGEGPTNTLFTDAHAGPTLETAARILSYLLEKSEGNQD